MKKAIPLLFAGLMTLIGFGAQNVAAQSPYSAKIVLNDRAVTYFEIDQRAQLLAFLGTPGDIQKQALDNLIDERLQEYAAGLAGVSVSPDDVRAGMEEFVGRFQAELDPFLEQLKQAGIAEETFRDFVAAGLAWREVVGQKFAAQAQVTDAELDAALASGGGGGIQVRMAEIILPLTPGVENQTLQLASDLSRNLRGNQAFSDSAAIYSASPTKANGGLLDWLPISQLPPQLASQILTLTPGQVSDPIPLPGAVAIFQMRGLREGAPATARPLSVEYASLMLPGGRSEATLATAQKIIDSVDTCHDLQIAAQKYAPGTFELETRALARIPHDISKELARLDDREVSTNLTRGVHGENLLLLMLCGRTKELPEGEREQLRQSLFVGRLDSLGRGYLEDLRADAIITEK